MPVMPKELQSPSSDDNSSSDDGFPEAIENLAARVFCPPPTPGRTRRGIRKLLRGVKDGQDKTARGQSADSQAVTGRRSGNTTPTGGELRKSQPVHHGIIATTDFLSVEAIAVMQYALKMWSRLQPTAIVKLKKKVQVRRVSAGVMCHSRVCHRTASSSVKNDVTSNPKRNCTQISGCQAVN